MRIYLDNCCFNRPYDDQSSLLVYLETEAKLCVQRNIVEGTFDLVWSYVLNYENRLNPHNERRQSIAQWRYLAKIVIVPSMSIMSFADGISSGIKEKDALHIACALEAGSDYFLTTDKRLLNKRVDGITIINPIDFVRMTGVEK